MPPIRRGRKVGLKRIDAALDALRPMGFPDHLVRKTVRNLLKAYGGDDGWAFIEECSYKLVIDTILEESEKDNDEEPKLLMQHADKENNEPKLLLMMESKMETKEPTLLIKDELREDAIVCSAQSPDTLQHPQKHEEPGENLQAASAHLQAKQDNTTCTSSIDDLGKQFPSARMLSAGFHSPEPCSLPALRHKPCYGWLSSDDEEEPDTLPVTPAV